MSSAPLPHGITPEVRRTPLTETFDFGSLSRWPLPESPEQQAHDAADLLLLDTAQAWWDVGHAAGSTPAPVVVLEDLHGALTLPLLAQGHPVRISQDGLAQERSLDANLVRLLPGDAPNLSRHGSGARLVDGAATVLLQLPRSLDALDQWARLVAEYALPDVVVLAGGRDKHMTPRQNTVLERYFTDVVPGRGRSKSRVLTARGPRRGRPDRFPLSAEHPLPDVGPVTLAAFGATFGGAHLDPGTALLLDHLRPVAERLASSDRCHAVDVGCGNGTIAIYLAMAARQLAVTPREGTPGVTARIVATDQSADACASTALTAEWNGVRDLVEVRRDDALASFPDASEDLLVLNPPFHAGNSVDSRVALRLLAEAARVLRPGGELWCVWNSHLQYRPELERRVGPTRQLARNRTFTVTVSTRP